MTSGRAGVLLQDMDVESTEKAFARAYQKGVRVSAPESPEFWRMAGVSRRDRHRIAKRAYRAGRMSEQTYRYLTAW